MWPSLCDWYINVTQLSISFCSQGTVWTTHLQVCQNSIHIQESWTAPGLIPNYFVHQVGQICDLACITATWDGFAAPHNSWNSAAIHLNTKYKPRWPGFCLQQQYIKFRQHSILQGFTCWGVAPSNKAYKSMRWNWLSCSSQTWAGLISPIHSSAWG